MTTATATEIKPQVLPRLFTDLTISNYKTHGNGMEGPRYSLTLNVNGIPTAVVNEDGTGGGLRIEGVYRPGLKNFQAARQAALALEARIGAEIGESSEPLGLVVEYLLRFDDTEREAKKAAKKGYEMTVLLLSEPCSIGITDETDVTPETINPLTTYFRRNYLVSLRSAADLEALIAKEQPAYYYAVKADNVAAVDDELDALKAMLKKYRRQDSTVTGVVLMRDGERPGKVVKVSPRFPLDMLQKHFKFTDYRLVEGGK